MGKKWIPVPIDSKHYKNFEETALTKSAAALENGFQNEAGRISRFPGLTVFKNLDDNGKIFLEEWRNDLVAVSSHGSTFRLDEDANTDNVTAVHVQGGGRVIIAETDDELVMAAGAFILGTSDKLYGKSCRRKSIFMISFDSYSIHQGFNYETFINFKDFLTDS